VKEKVQSEMIVSPASIEKEKNDSGVFEHPS
jgi:hypothetical protein